MQLLLHVVMGDISDKGHLGIGLRAIRRNATLVRTWKTWEASKCEGVGTTGHGAKETMRWEETDSNVPVGRRQIAMCL